MKILLRLLCVFICTTGLKANQGSERNLSSAIENDEREQESRNAKSEKGNTIFLRIASHMKDQNTTSGGNVQFKCKVDGRPKNNIEFTWYKEDLLIDPKYDSRVSIATRSWGSRLKITNLLPLDTGTYKCVGAIGLESVTSSARLTVTSEFPLTPTEDNEPEIGKCEKYRGAACRDFIEGRNIYVDAFQDQLEMETQITTAMHQLSNRHSVSETCQKFVLPGLCHSVFTPCQLGGNGDIKRGTGLCKEDCERFEHDICHKNQFRKQANLLLKHLFDVSSCLHLPSAEDSTCSRISFPLDDVADGCYHGAGEDYRGGCSTSATKLSCKSWPLRMVKEYPELAGGHNFCRNPANIMGRPWCFVDEARMERAVCDVPKCENEDGGNDVLLYVLPCACAVVIIVIIGVFVGCRHKKRKRRLETSETNPEVLSAQKPLLPYDKPMVPQLTGASIRLLSEIGNGEYGKIYKGIIVDDPRFTSKQPIAIKMLDNNNVTSQLEPFLREMQITSELRHLNVTCLKAVVLQPGFHCMVFEHSDQLDLHECLVRNSPNSDVTQPIASNGHASPSISNASFIRLISQIASGMEYLSSHNYIHRDLAARNVLVCGNMDLKICNLGVVRDPYLSSYYRSPQGRLLPIRWMAPESLQSWQFSDKSAVWSFGVLLWEMFSYGLQPYCGYSNHEVLDMISRRQLLTCPDQCPAKMYSLMHECWTVQSQLRPNFNEICVKLKTWIDERPNPVHGQNYSRRNLQLNSYIETSLSVPSDYASHSTANSQTWMRSGAGSERSGRYSVTAGINTTSSQCSSSREEQDLDGANHYHNIQRHPFIQEQFHHPSKLNEGLMNTASRDSGIPSEDRDTASSFSGVKSSTPFTRLPLSNNIETFDQTIGSFSQQENAAT